MEEIIEAVYENGVLKPLKPLRLREHEKVRIKIIKGDIIELTRKFREIITPENFDESPEEYLLKLREERI
ncbi:antitoxin family protein [Thermococcus sp.]